VTARRTAGDEQASVDGAGPVRSGEELDAGRLGAYLREALGAPGASLEVQQFPGGHSNLTYLVRLGDRELVLRRPPFGSKVKSAHDMGREHRILSQLAPVYPQAPRPLLHCEDASVIGAPFYVMERVRGVILRRRLPPGLALDPATARRASEALVDTLADLHALDHRAIGLGELGRPEGYIERQVRGWTERYAGSRTDDAPDAGRVTAWLAGAMPADAEGRVIHNDFKFDNLVLDPGDLGRIVGILDWELATIGDPLMDLGTTLAYWVEAGDPEPVRRIGFGPTAVPGMLTRREVLGRYRDRTGRDPGDGVFYYAFGLFKTAVIAQQIYYRYRQGLTHDERFSALGPAVGVLVEQAARAIDDRRV
jgi:aminoglycoside phosphotransferase (APT) family kinase protein